MAVPVTFVAKGKINNTVACTAPADSDIILLVNAEL